ncbi:FAD-dependent oxidoreductase [Cardiobacterium sp. AH-315-I02]|nr:FAD-dependent oxidoreductase [Cardiobacterium sp. AH-315-I02]
MAEQLTINNRLEQIDSNYQLVIIGGGVYGAALCWEAAHRGIKVLLVEQDDYACGASSNSLKTIHGGLRSLQSLNIKAVIKGIRERSIFLKIAPNYVKPLPCLLPTTGWLMKSKIVVGMGLLLYNMLCQITSLFCANDRKIPNARILSLGEFLNRASKINPEGITGGALWVDAQVTNTERLVWQFIKSAIKKGAVAVNHTIALKLTHDQSDGRHSVLIRDQITGFEKTVTTSAIVDSSAAWNFIKHCLPTAEQNENLTFLKSVNIIVKKKVFDNAVGASVKTEKTGSSRLYFLSPWRDCTMIGTWYSKVENYPENSFSYAEASDCIDEINTLFSEKLLHTDDICNVHIGFLPAKNNQHSDPLTLDQNLFSNYQLKDWSGQAGMDGVYSLRGTKYTLARYDAKQVVDRLAKTLKWKVAVSQSDHLPIYQAGTVPDNSYSLSDEIVSHLLMNYGADTEQVLSYIRKDPELAELIPGTQYHILAEINYVVFNEQVLTLCDLLKRRMDIGDRAIPELKTVNYCALIMQRLLLWSDDVLKAQISEFYASYPEFLTHQRTVNI